MVNEPYPRIAALYDIHGNLPALEAVLDAVSGCGVDLIVVGGDIFPGPMARDCLSLLGELRERVCFISGNGESAMIAHLRGDDLASLPEQARAAVMDAAASIDAPMREAIAQWPATLRLEIDAVGAVLFCHATPRSDTEIFTRLTPDEKVAPMFDGVGAPLVVCGHTHMPFDRRLGPTRIVNAGSVGMPFGRPGADWLLVGPDVQHRHTEYDREAAAARIRASRAPSAEAFILRSLLQPPGEAEMLQLYERAIG